MAKMGHNNVKNILASEFHDVSSGDERLNARLRRIASVLSEVQDCTLPGAHGRDINTTGHPFSGLLEAR